MVFKTNYCLMQVKSIICRIPQGEHSAILSTFIKLPFVIKIIILSMFDWPFYACFTVVFYFCTCAYLLFNMSHVNKRLVIKSYTFVPVCAYLLFNMSLVNKCHMSVPLVHAASGGITLPQCLLEIPQC